MKSVNYIDNMDQWRSEFSFFTPIKVRFSETDMYGHVNNVSAFILKKRESTILIRWVFLTISRAKKRQL